MTRSARDFYVYSCGACGKRIFSERSLSGRKGRCPLCKAVHVVGGDLMAEDGTERRRAPRVKPPGTQVKLKKQKTRGFSKAEIEREDTLAHDAFALEDLSETGFAFRLPGVRDPRRLAGLAPPPIKVGERIQIALHSAESRRPPTYDAEVRRVVPPGADGLYLTGARFVGLSDIQHTELKALVARLLEEGL